MNISERVRQTEKRRHLVSGVDKQAWQRLAEEEDIAFLIYSMTAFAILVAPAWQQTNRMSALLALLVKWVKGQRKLRGEPRKKVWIKAFISFYHAYYRVLCVWCVVAPERRVIPDLLIGFAADLEHLFALELQLFSQSADILVEGVDLVVQLGDVILPSGDLLLQLGDPAQQLTLLGWKSVHISDDEV